MALLVILAELRAAPILTALASFVDLISQLRQLYLLCRFKSGKRKKHNHSFRYLYLPLKSFLMSFFVILVNLLLENRVLRYF